VQAAVMHARRAPFISQPRVHLREPIFPEGGHAERLGVALGQVTAVESSQVSGTVSPVARTLPQVDARAGCGARGGGARARGRARAGGARQWRRRGGCGRAAGQAGANGRPAAGQWPAGENTRVASSAAEALHGREWERSIAPGVVSYEGRLRAAGLRRQARTQAALRR